MLSADPERAERHDGLLTSGGRSRGGILALCWVTPTPARRQHAAVSHEQSAQIYVYISKSLHLGACPLPGVYLVALFLKTQGVGAGHPLRGGWRPQYVR